MSGLALARCVPGNVNDPTTTKNLRRQAVVCSLTLVRALLAETSRVLQVVRRTPCGSL